jgi:hypothetical protein
MDFPLSWIFYGFGALFTQRLESTHSDLIRESFAVESFFNGASFNNEKLRLDFGFFSKEKLFLINVWGFSKVSLVISLGWRSHELLIVSLELDEQRHDDETQVSKLLEFIR